MFKSDQQLDVHKLAGNIAEHSLQKNLLLKLTDECSLALRKAIASKELIRLHVNNKSISLEVFGEGDLSKFDCHAQNLNVPLDAIYCDKKKTYRSVASINIKLQVAATAKSFSDVREKHLKLIGEEEKKKTKELPNKSDNSKTSKIDAILQKKSLPSEQRSILAKTKSLVPKTTAAPFVKRYNLQTQPQTSKDNLEVANKNKEFLKKARIEEKTKDVVSDLIGCMDNLEILLKPSRDWSVYFKEIQSDSEAQEYQNIFNAEYPTYKDCYEGLYKISHKLLDLKSDYENAQNSGQNSEDIFNEILIKTELLRRDKEFLAQRRQHVDLNAKLKALKSRITDWESKQVTKNKSTMYCDANFDL